MSEGKGGRRFNSISKRKICQQMLELAVTKDSVLMDKSGIKQAMPHLFNDLNEKVTIESLLWAKLVTIGLTGKGNTQVNAIKEIFNRMYGAASVDGEQNTFVGTMINFNDKLQSQIELERTEELTEREKMLFDEAEIIDNEE